MNKYSAIDVQSINDAIAMAVEAHSSQVDKNGQPYIFHPLRVMNEVYFKGADISTIRAAVLHDVVEDTDVTLDAIEVIFGDQTAELVQIVSRLGDETYKEFIEFIALDPDATLIKLADIRDNMNPDRLVNKPGIYKRYAAAYYRLTYGVWPK